MARITQVTSYFQGSCFPQKFVSVQVGFGATATLEPGDNAAEVEGRLYRRVRARVETEIEAIMRNAPAEPERPGAGDEIETDDQRLDRAKVRENFSRRPIRR